jgi:hypothetical protein
MLRRLAWESKKTFSKVLNFGKDGQDQKKQHAAAIRPQLRFFLPYKSPPAGGTMLNSNSVAGSIKIVKTIFRLLALFILLTF